MTAALELAVAKRVGAFDLDVAFRVESGISVLFGPSGAGKSLTLALIAGLARPDTGTIVIGGRTVTDCARGTHVSTQDRRLGMVFQDGLLLPHRSVRDNVALAVRQASGRQARRKLASYWLERVGAEDLSDRRPGSLSGGQRQRVALARVILKDAPILVLDEATSALDSEVEAAIQEQLDGLMRGRTVIAIAHRLSTIARMDRLVVLDHGRIVEEGSHAALLCSGGAYAGLWRRQSGGFQAADVTPIIDAASAAE